jgi:hypothetical protein
MREFYDGQGTRHFTGLEKVHHLIRSDAGRSARNFGRIDELLGLPLRSQLYQQYPRHDAGPAPPDFLAQRSTVSSRNRYEIVFNSHLAGITPVTRAEINFALIRYSHNGWAPAARTSQVPNKGKTKPTESGLRGKFLRRPPKGSD